MTGQWPSAPGPAYGPALRLAYTLVAYIWCQFEAYLCRNNWQQNLNTSTEWADRQKYKN
jgi:hypothetical protein